MKLLESHKDELSRKQYMKSPVVLQRIQRQVAVRIVLTFFYTSNQENDLLTFVIILRSR
jgi:hypothetical protein